jgi:hypothetical protein
MYFKNSSVKTNKDWDLPIALPPDCLQELKWWLKNLSKWNGRSLLTQTPTHTMYVDASNLGWGGV